MENKILAGLLAILVLAIGFGIGYNSNEVVVEKKIVETVYVDKIVNTTVVVRARKSRVADAVVITSRAKLTNRITTEKTKFLYNPEVIFLKEPIELVQGEYYDVHINYPYGCDTLDVLIDVKIKNK